MCRQYFWDDVMHSWEVIEDNRCFSNRCTNLYFHAIARGRQEDNQVKFLQGPHGIVKPPKNLVLNNIRRFTQMANGLLGRNSDQLRPNLEMDIWRSCALTSATLCRARMVWPDPTRVRLLTSSQRRIVRTARCAALGRQSDHPPRDVTHCFTTTCGGLGWTVDWTSRKRLQRMSDIQQTATGSATTPEFYLRIFFN